MPGGKDAKASAKMDKYLSPAQAGGKTRSVKNTTGGNAEGEESFHLEPDSVGKILRAITKCNSAIDDLAAQVGSMRCEMTIIRDEISKVRERCTEAENRVSVAEDDMSKLKKEVTELQKDNKAMKDKLTDIENRSRRNNLRILGIPEGEEKTDPTGFVENLLEKQFNDILSSAFAVERAHRIPIRTTVVGNNPRPIIARIIMSRDRDAILRKAREVGDWKYDNSRVAIYPDFSMETQRARAQFINVKKRLRLNEKQYAMFYPAKLRVITEGKTWFFHTPEEADKWMDSQGLK